MRDHGMFGFLMEGNEHQSGKDLETLKEFAKQAASSFLGQDRVPLNHTIQKTAQVEKLTPDQISILCQEANKSVHEHMFKTAENKYVDFEIADPEVIVSEIDTKLSKTASANNLDAVFSQELSRLEKSASVESSEIDDFSFAPGEKKSYTSDFSFTKQAGHDGLKVPEEHLKKVAMEKKAQRLKDIEGEMIILNGQIESAEKNFIKEARNMLLPYPAHERANKFELIAQFCKEAGLPKERFEKVASLTEHVMKRQGLLEKKASLKADEQYISDKLDAKVINGDHALIIHIKTLVDKDKRKEALKNEHNLIKTEIENRPGTIMDGEGCGAILGQKVKEL